MDITLGRLQLSVTMSRAPSRRRGWEELAAVELDDRELARLNRANTRDPVAAQWEGVAWRLGVKSRGNL